MKESYDIVIVGGGHNGLTAATALAQKGKRVLVVERNTFLGGIAAAEELEDGYRTSGLMHDTTNVRKAVVESLGLKKHGLELLEGRPAYLLLGRNGESVRISADRQETAKQISQYSASDAEAYIVYHDFIDKIRPFINDLMGAAPPDLVQLGAKDVWEFLKKAIGLKRLGNATMLELLKVAPMSVADYLNEKFETDFIKAGICAPAIYHSYTGPWSSYTMVNLLIWECAAMNHVKGGAQQLINALEKAATAAGVDIETGSGAKELLLNSAKAIEGVKLNNDVTIKAPLVMSSCTPHVTFYDLLKPSNVEYNLEYGIKHYRTRGTAVKVNLILNGAPTLNGQSGIEFARTGNSFDDMEKAFDAVKYRQFSPEPVLDIHVPTGSEPGLASDGKHVMSIWAHFAPYQLEEGWSDKSKDDLGKAVIDTLEQYSPGIAQSVSGIQVDTPQDLENKYGLTNGHLYHGEHAVDQLLTRPIPECMKYATPIKGLYLCGSGSHPGGGITCAPGYIASQEVLKR